jgi:tartronate-semialdehyde synthase
VLPSQLAYLGLIRQSQRGFAMDLCVHLPFENVNTPELGAYASTT